MPLRTAFTAVLERAGDRLRGPRWRWLYDETVHGALVLALFILFFLGAPIVQFRTHYYAPVDFIQAASLTTVEPGYIPHNGLTGDPVVVLLPWMMFNRDSLRVGRLPLWNPYNGGGVPHLANFQSAVFSPYSLPFYFGSLRAALVIAPFVKLFTLGFFTFLFLKQIGVRQGGAMLGATVFTFSAQNVLWLGYHNTESAIVLPAGLYFVEKALRVVQPQFDPFSGRSYRHTFWYIVGLGFSIATGLVAGHPETFLFSFFLLASYIFYRLTSLSISQRYDFAVLVRLVRIGLLFVLAGVLAASSTAVQILPFLEYFVNSSVALGRTGVTGAEGALIKSLLPLWLFPNLLGSPTTPFQAINNTTLITNYIEANTSYIGGLALVLFGVSAIRLRHAGPLRFFWGAALVWFFYSYNLLGVGHLFSSIPLIAILPIMRSQVIWAFSASCGAAFGCDYLLHQSRAAARRDALLVFAGGVSLLIAGLVGIALLLKKFSPFVVPSAQAFLDYVPGHIAWIAVSFGFGLLALVGLCLTRERTWQAILYVSVLLVIFAQSGYLLRNFIPTIEDKYFYPITPSIAHIQRIAGAANVVVAGNDAITPDTNMVYHFSMPGNYDAIWIRYYDRLYQRLYGSESFPRISSKVNAQGLKLFGVDYLALPGDWPAVDTELAEVRSNSKIARAVGEIGAGRSVVQTFTPSKDGLQGVAVALATYGRSNTCTLEIRVEDVAARSAIGQRTLRCQDVLDSGDVVVSFPPVANSRGKLYQLVLTSPDGQPGNGLAAWSKADFAYSGGALTFDSQHLSGALSFDLSYNLNDFTPVATLRNKILYQYLASPSRYYTVSQAIASQSDERALATILDPDFDPARTVVLSQAASPEQTVNQGITSPVEVLAEESTRIHLQVERTQDGYLVMTKPYYPGWKARVNGLEQPILRANYAFSAIRVGAGESDVIFSYEPESFRIGLLVTLATGAIVFGFVAQWFVYRRRRSTSPGEAARQDGS